MKIACQQKKYKLNLNKKGIDNYVKVQFFQLKKRSWTISWKFEKVLSLRGADRFKEHDYSVHILKAS